MLRSLVMMEIPNNFSGIASVNQLLKSALLFLVAKIK